MFAFITKMFKNAAKEKNLEARVAKWTAIKEELMAMKFRLVDLYELLTYGTYNRAMKDIKRRLARVNKLLDMAAA